MSKTMGITAIAMLLFLLPAGPAYAAQRGAGQPPAAPQRLFSMTMQNEMRSSLTQSAVTTPNVDLELYGDGGDIIVATGTNAYLPRLFFGLCRGPCGFTLRDRDNNFDLRGRARIRLTTIVSGFHLVRPIIKLADGTLLIADQAVGSTADWIRSISRLEIAGGSGWIRFEALPWGGLG